MNRTRQKIQWSCLVILAISIIGITDNERKLYSQVPPGGAGIPAAVFPTAAFSTTAGTNVPTYASAPGAKPGQNSPAMSAPGRAVGGATPTIPPGGITSNVPGAVPNYPAATAATPANGGQANRGNAVSNGPTATPPQDSPVVAALMKLPPGDTRIVGAPFPLKNFVDASGGTRDRFERVSSYWSCSEKLAVYNVILSHANDVEACIKRHTGPVSPNDATLHQSVRLLASQRVHEAEIELIQAQFALAERYRGGTERLNAQNYFKETPAKQREILAKYLPIPTDVPTSANYNTRMAEIAKVRYLSGTAKTLGIALPLQYDVVKCRIDESNQSYTNLLTLFKSPNIPDTLLFEMLDRTTDAKLAMVKAVIEYNRMIAAYSAETVAGNVRGNRYLATLNIYKGGSTVTSTASSDSIRPVNFDTTMNSSGRTRTFSTESVAPISTTVPIQGNQANGNRQPGTNSVPFQNMPQTNQPPEVQPLHTANPSTQTIQTIPNPITIPANSATVPPVSGASPAVAPLPATNQAISNQQKPGPAIPKTNSVPSAQPKPKREGEPIDKNFRIPTPNSPLTTSNTVWIIRGQSIALPTVKPAGAPPAAPAGPAQSPAAPAASAQPAVSPMGQAAPTTPAAPANIPLTMPTNPAKSATTPVAPNPPATPTLKAPAVASPSAAPANSATVSTGTAPWGASGSPVANPAAAPNPARPAVSSPTNPTARPAVSSSPVIGNKITSQQHQTIAELVRFLFPVKANQSGAGDSPIIEIPLSLATAVNAGRDPAARCDLVERYWKLRAKMAEFEIEKGALESCRLVCESFDRQNQTAKSPEIIALVGTFRAALLAGEARIARIKIDMRFLQIELMQFMSGTTEKGWPLPSSLPYCGPTYRLESERVQRNTFTLAIESVLIPEKLEMVQQVGLSLGPVAELYRPKIASLATPADGYLYLKTLDNKRKSAIFFVEEVVSLNNSIARYVTDYSSIPIPNDVFVKSLIGTNNEDTK